MDTGSHPFAVRCREGTDFFENKSVIKRKDFKANQTVYMKPGCLKIFYRCVAGPWAMGLGRDHGKNSVSLIVESELTQYERWSPLDSRPFCKREGDNNNVPGFTDHGRLHRLPVYPIRRVS